MSIKNELRNLVALQGRELELLRVAEEIAGIGRTRTAARAEVETAQQQVSEAEKTVEEARAEARRLDVDLKAAEDRVLKFKDHILDVKTNKELWALQEEIGQAESAVGDVQTKILEQLEIADSLEAVIGDRKNELAQVTTRVEAAIAAADRREQELEAERQVAVEAMALVRENVPADLLKKFEDIKRLRGGVAVAEALDETCMVCNTKMRPQLYVEVFHCSDVIQCENCGRIMYLAERLGLQPPPEAATDASH